jgi:hypothetical protein
MTLSSILQIILIITTLVLYGYNFISISKSFIFNPIYTFIVLVYLIAYTSININLCNSIEDKNIEDKKSLSKNINITILSISVISLLLLIATHFSPYGKVVTKFANIGNDIANNIL